MKHDPQKHHGRSIRLKEYAYSQAGAYHVAIVAQNRACLSGNVVNAEMQLNGAGETVQSNGSVCRIDFPMWNWMNSLSCRIIFTAFS